MKFITYRANGRERTAVLSADNSTVYDLAALGCDFESMNDLICRLTAEDRSAIAQKLGSPAAAACALPYGAVEKCAPIPRPRQDVICVGINYAAHATEAARYKAEAFGGERPYPIYFSKRVNQAVPDGGAVESHADIEHRLDYEAELGVIIGKEARYVVPEEAYNCIFGYTIINDISAREAQTRHKQWYFGKSMDGFLPMGPCIVTADEIPGKPELNIRCRVNGELRQNSNTRLLIFDIAYIISELSRGITLLPGTIIATGTPAGVGMGLQPPVFLRSGDVVECEIEGIGLLTNTIA